MISSQHPPAPITRRAAMAGCAALLFVFAMPSPVHAHDPEPLRFPPDFSRSDFESLLHPRHPRLLARESDWKRIRESLPSSPHLIVLQEALEAAAWDILDQPPAEREMIGRRLLHVSREVLRRVLTLAALHRLTGEEIYFQRCRSELLAAAAFPDWNPSHFLDTAEMTLAVAIGYDWLHDSWSVEERALLRGAILAKGLQPGLGSHRWKQSDNNWNQVCYAGMVAGALAVGEHEPETAVYFLREAMANIHRPLDACRPHGAYPEGPSYWSYGTHFQVILVEILRSALGTTWGLENYPGFQESAAYINLMVGPSGQFFNYADGSASVSIQPALHWFATKARNPALDSRERQALLNRDSGIFRPGGFRVRFLPLGLLWLDPDLDTTAASELPLHWRADGPNPLATHRSSWDREALFVALKGGSPRVNHGHMDIGSFVLDWGGQRWAVDLGMQDYHSLESLGLGIWNRAQDSDRWRVFRMGTFSHNTLVIDGKQQLVEGFAPLTAFSDGPAAPFTEVDMTAVYADSVTKAVRRAELPGRDRVLLTDHLEDLGPEQTVRWGMVTRAAVELRGDSAVLRMGNREMTARILSPETGAWELVPTDPPPADFDAPNPGTRMLAFTAGGNPSGATELRVLIEGMRD